MSIDVVLFNTGVFQPGQNVEGKVVCVFTSSTEIRGVRLKLKGKEHTSWEAEETYTDDDTKETKWRTVQYSGDNTFLEFQENLIGHGTQNPGRYEYPFRFILPRVLPGTYNSPNGGYIRYTLKANVDIPMASDYVNEKFFNVQSIIDLNETQGLPLNPIQLQDEKTICCWCCADGPISMDVHLERGVFVLGESMKLKIDVENNSNESLQQMKVEVKNTIEEKVTSPSYEKKYSETVLASEVETGVGAHGNRTYNFDIRIPPNVELPNFETCTLFQQYCELKVEASLPGPHTNLRLEQKIKLGHIPPRSIGAPPQLYPSGDFVPSYPTVPTPNQPPYPTGPGWMQPSPASTPYPPAVASAPSAPTKAELAAGYGSPDGGSNAGTNNELPPPSYNDIVKQ